MFPRITDMFNYILGTHWTLPVQTYGFFLALAFLVGGAVLRMELVRKEKEGHLPARTKRIQKNKPAGWPEILGNALLSAVVGFKFAGILFDYSSFSANPQKYLLSGQGSLPAAILILAGIIGYALLQNRKLRNSRPEWTDELVHPFQSTWNILIISVIAALVGSKIFDIADNFGGFLRNPMDSLFSFSGLTFYGGFIVTVLTLVFYNLYVLKMDWRYLLDTTAPAIMIGYAVGRLGCHFSGDGCWGIINEMAKPGWLAWLPDWAWAFNYPHNVLNHGIPIPGCIGPNCGVLAKPVWPTSLYESMVSFLFFGILWSLRKKIKAPVVIFGVFMVLNGIERFLIEHIRVNNRFNLLGMQLTQAEIISFLLIMVGMGLILLFSYRFKKEEANSLEKSNQSQK